MQSNHCFSLTFSEKVAAYFNLRLLSVLEYMYLGASAKIQIRETRKSDNRFLIYKFLSKQISLILKDLEMFHTDLKLRFCSHQKYASWTGLVKGI